VTTDAYRLVESTTWRIGAIAPTPIDIALSCGHVLHTNSDAVALVIRQNAARPTTRENHLRIEMRCALCEEGKGVQ
jgi:hypothetical protein